MCSLGELLILEDAIITGNYNNCILPQFEQKSKDMSIDVDVIKTSNTNLDYKKNLNNDILLTAPDILSDKQSFSFTEEIQTKDRSNKQKLSKQQEEDEDMQMLEFLYEKNISYTSDSPEQPVVTKKDLSEDSLLIDLLFFESIYSSTPVSDEKQQLTKSSNLVVDETILSRSEGDYILNSDILTQAFWEITQIMTLQSNCTGIDDVFPIGQHFYLGWGLLAWVSDQKNNKTSAFNHIRYYLNSLADRCKFDENILLPIEQISYHTLAYYKSVAIIFIAAVYGVIRTYSWGPNIYKQLCEKQPSSKCLHSSTSPCCNILNNTNINGNVNYCLTELLLQILDAMDTRPYLARQYLWLNYIESYSESKEKYTLFQMIPKMVWKVTVPYAKCRYEAGFPNMWSDKKKAKIYAPSIRIKKRPINDTSISPLSRSDGAISLVTNSEKLIKSSTTSDDEQVVHQPPLKRVKVTDNIDTTISNIHETTTLVTNTNDQNTADLMLLASNIANDSVLTILNSDNTNYMSVDDTEEIEVMETHIRSHHPSTDNTITSAPLPPRSRVRNCKKCNSNHNGPCGPCTTPGCTSKRTTKVSVISSITNWLVSSNTVSTTNNEEIGSTTNNKSKTKKKKLQTKPKILDRTGLTIEDRSKMIRPKLLIACAYCQNNCRCLLCIENEIIDTPIFFVSFQQTSKSGRKIRGPLIFCNKECYESFESSSRASEKPKFDDTETLSDNIIEFNRQQKQILFAKG